jgi:uncharacterized protein YlaN (UPF0358 family)
MQRIIALATAALLFVMIPVTGEAKMSKPAASVLRLSLVGPHVKIGVKYTFYYEVKNAGKTILKRVKVHMTPVDIIAKCVVPCQKSVWFYDPQKTASWLLTNVRPGQTRRIPVQLQFPSLNGVPRYNVVLDAQVLGTSLRADILWPVRYAVGY